MLGRIRTFVLLALLVAATGVGLSTNRQVLEAEQTLGLGSLFLLRGALPAPSEVAVVSLSTESAEALGQTADVDRWSRQLHADLISRLADAGAAVIAIDLIFAAERDPAVDARLAAAVRRAGNVILLERVRSETQEAAAGTVAFIESRIKPIEPLASAALGTAPFTLPKVPILLGQYWTFGRSQGDHASLPAAALHAYALPVHDLFINLLASAGPGREDLSGTLGRRAVTVRGLDAVMRDLRGLFARMPDLAGRLHARLAEAALAPVERHLLAALIDLYGGPESRYLKFYGPARTVDTIPYDKALRDLDDAALAAAVRGKAVFIGFSDPLQPEQQDEFLSVFSSRGESLSGVEIGATAFLNLLHVDEVRPVPLVLHWALVAVWGLAVAVLPLFATSRGALLAAVAGALAYGVTAFLVFRTSNVWLPIVVPLGVQLPLAMLVGLSLSHRQLRLQRERIQAALGYYLPPAAVARLATETTRPRGRRELVFGTCLVTDAEQYTTLSEALHPTQLGELMDAYYDVLVEAVHRHGGVVSDIGGDSMVAVWPAAGSNVEARLAACRGALEVLTAVESFNRQRVNAELPTRIGIDCGPLLLGTMGARVRGEFRAVGDIVNTAARLQGLNRLLGTRILLSSAVPATQMPLAVRPLGDFLLVGKRTPVAVVELRAAAAPDEVERRYLAQFADALARFRSGRWREARMALETLLELRPDDGAARFLADQCTLLASRYRDGQWDGVVHVAVK